MIEYNECKNCGAKDGRAGYLIDDECRNCHETRESGNICIHTHLERTDEEIAKTMKILDED